MISTYTGKPRSGKSYGALKREILDEALRGNRVIVTNLAIIPEEFAQYLHDVHPKCDFDVTKRLVVITKEEAKRFWLIRSADRSKDIEDTSVQDQKKGIFPDFGPHAGLGVLFVIDEAHVLFDARGWAQNGLALTYYNSQHGKLNDDVIFITQFLGLLDTRCKSFSQFYRVYRNYKFEKVFTFFRTPGYLEERSYTVEPKNGIDHDERHEYRLDPRLAKCYDTSAGVGISGRGKPESFRFKGLNFGWLVAGLVSVCVGLWFLADLPVYLVGKSDGGKAAKKAIYGEDKSAPGAKPDTPHLVDRPSVRENTPPQPERKQALVSDLDERSVVGYVARNGRVNVVMSDGVIYTEDDPELEHVYRTSVVISGRRYPIKSGGWGSPQIGQAKAPAVAPLEAEALKSADTGS